MNKTDVITAFREDLQQKRKRLIDELAALREGLIDDSKNSSGDKHETSRAMNQIEQERIGKQLIQLDEQIEHMQSITTQPSKTVTNGSLVRLNDQWFLVAGGLGKQLIHEKPVFSLSLQSPLGELLKGKGIGETISFNGNTFLINEIH